MYAVNFVRLGKVLQVKGGAGVYRKWLTPAVDSQPKMLVASSSPQMLLLPNTEAGSKCIRLSGSTDTGDEHG